MKLGFSFSPGGLLLPYHLGVLASLEYHPAHYLNDSTPLAGASAGAIAVAAHANGLSPRHVLDWTVDLCAHCQTSSSSSSSGGVRGRLLPLLKQQLHRRIGDAQFEQFQQRPGKVGIAYKEIYPQQRNVLQTVFDNRQDLVTAICHSSMFPFFTSEYPCLLDFQKDRGLRLVVDGAFAVPWERLGCPELLLESNNNSNNNISNNHNHDGWDASQRIDREVRVSVVPPPGWMLTSDRGDHADIIAPSWDGPYQLGRLARLAVQGSDRTEMTWLYEAGMQDAERWCRNEETREQTKRLAHRKNVKETS